MSTHKSIAGLRIYQASRQLEDSVYELVKQLPEDEFYRLGNDLRRSSAAISHYIAECHRRYSYSVKLEALHLARTETESLRALLQDYTSQGFGDTAKLQDSCIGIVKQSWALIKYLKHQQSERQQQIQIAASDQLVAVHV